MELTPSDYYRKVGEALSIANVELLVNIWVDSAGLGTTGKEVRKMITEAIPQIAKDNRLPSADTFRELVRNYDDINALTRNFLVSNGYLVLPRDQKIPYTLDRFLTLLSYSKLRGMRVIFSNKNGELMTPRDWYETVFAIKKVGAKLRFIFFYSEEYNPGNSFLPEKWSLFDLTRAEKEKLYIDTTPEDLEEDFRDGPIWRRVLGRFFDPTYQLEDSGIRFVSREKKNIFLLMEESFTIVKKFILLENLDDDGEYHTVLRDSKREFAYALITPNSFCFKFLTEGVDSFMIKHSHYLVTGLSDVNTRTPEETASYLAYHANERWDMFKRTYKRIAKRFNVYTGFVHFARLAEIKYACINTGARVLCLITERPIPKLKDFTVVAHRREGELHFYSIILR